MRANRLWLNPAKTKVLWCLSPRRQHLIPTGAIHTNNTSELPVHSVRDLGVYIEADTAMKSHVIMTVKACFTALRQIRSVRCSLPQHALLTLIRALMVSKVDYCNSELARISGRHMDRLQSILNAAAHLVVSVRKSEPITPLLRELHWLRVLERMLFRLCILVYRYLQGTALPYLAESLHKITEVIACAA